MNVKGGITQQQGGGTLEAEEYRRKADITAATNTRHIISKRQHRNRTDGSVGLEGIANKNQANDGTIITLAIDAETRHPL